MSKLAYGTAGQIRAGYRVAADLGAWTLDLLGTAFGTDSWEITADVARADGYWLDHGGAFEIRLRLARSWWCWRDVAIERSGDRVTIRGRGKPEVRAA